MNRCDVSGQECNRAECQGGYNTDNCTFFTPQEYSDKCYHYAFGYCSSLDAIRAAIKAEGMTMNCPDCGAEKILLCDCWRKE